MKEKYAFDWQTLGTCGQISTVHCLALLGIIITNIEAHNATGIHPIEAKIRGTDSKYIRKALRHYNCKPVEYDIKNPDVLKQKINKLLDKHIPLILSCDDWEHWAVLAGRNGRNKYYWIDSGNSDLMGYSTWNEIKDWIETEDSYFFIAAIPHDDSKAVKNIPGLYKIYKNNEELFLKWGYLLADLVDVFDGNKNSSKRISAKEFFEGYKNIILETIEQLYLDTDKEEIKEKLNNKLVVLKISPELKKIASLDTIIKLREL